MLHVLARDCAAAASTARVSHKKSPIPRDLAAADTSPNRPAALPSSVTSRSDQHGDEPHHEADARYDDDPYTEDEDRGWLPCYPSWGWGGARDLPFPARREEEAYSDEGAYEGSEDGFYDEDDDGSLWDEGLITLLIVAGVVLFLFPEPATSGLGVLLLSIGVIAWLIDWAM